LIFTGKGGKRGHQLVERASDAPVFWKGGGRTEVIFLWKGGEIYTEGGE